jgi:hypothetical protein
MHHARDGQTILGFLVLDSVPARYGCTDGTNPLPVPGFTFDPEFVDNIDIPGRCTLTVRVRLEDRPLPNRTPGGGLGRWMFHCHIFFHHHQGMVSELSVVRPEVTITNGSGGLLCPVGTNVTVDGRCWRDNHRRDDNGSRPSARRRALWRCLHAFTQAVPRSGDRRRTISDSTA